MSIALDRLRAAISDRGIGAVVVSDPKNVGWLTGFSGTYARVIVTETHARFLTDSRYTLQAEEEVKGFDVRWFQAPVQGNAFLAENLGELGIRDFGFESATTSYADFLKLQADLAGFGLSPVGDLFSELRTVKSPSEVEAIKKACGITDAALVHIERLIQPGVSEYDIELDLEFFIRRSGAGLAFPMIVVSGERSARPHGHASEKKLESGDFLTIDFGARVDGYNSDITRTFVVGEASARHQEVYGAVLEAQLAALDALKPGANGRDVDGVARKVLAKYGLADYFGHGLGHGLGLDVHDGGRLSPSVDQAIQPGNVWTIEPGVYLPGFGGVRIEDDVLVTESGIEILTHYPKALTVLPR